MSRQTVNFSTRIDNILDIFGTNGPSLLERCVTLPGIIDHDVVLLDLCFYSCTQEASKEKGLWKRTNKQAILNEQFVSAFNKDNASMPTMGTRTANTAPPLNIQVNGVKNMLLGQNLHKASGPNRISPRFLKEMASLVAPVLTSIYQASYE